MPIYIEMISELCHRQHWQRCNEQELCYLRQNHWKQEEILVAYDQLRFCAMSSTYLVTYGSFSTPSGSQSSDIGWQYVLHLVKILIKAPGGI